MLLTVTAIVACLLLPVVQSQTLIIVHDSSINATIRDTANFTVKPSRPVKSGNWDFNGKSIGQWIGTSVAMSNEYKSRAQILMPDGSLELKSVTTSDSGEYTVTMVPEVGDQASATIILHVIEPVSKPNVTANATNLIEFNDTVALTCIASGTAVSYQWLEENSPITPSDRIALSDDNSSLTISGVLRSDGGFACYAFNDINGMTSDPYHLNISYGPDLPKISIKPDLSTYPTGRMVTFSCSVDSNPSAELEWLHNDTHLQQKGRDLIIVSISLNESGNYTCQAFNNLTKRCNASTKQIVVIEPVSNVTISSNNSAPVESLHTILLTCHAMGSIQSRIWYKDNKVVKNNDRMMTSEDNAMLTIINVDRNDSGMYTCHVFGNTNNVSGNFNLIINYGPDEVIIRPPGSNQLEPGASLTLSCSASSVPAAIYKWYNDDSPLQMGQTYNIDSASQSSSGNYTCQAHNTITKKNRSSTVEVTIQEKTPHSSKVSVGAIVGTVIGVLAGVFVIVVIAWQIGKKHSRGNSGCQQNNSIMTSPGSGPAASSNGTNPENMASGTDVVYAQPNINPLHQGPTAPPAPTDSNKTDYAELKFR